MPAIAVHNNARALKDFSQLEASSGIQPLTKRILSEPSLQIPEPVQSQHLYARQFPGAIPAVYQGLDAGPAPGTVAGIVLGSVAGFILLIWLFSALSGNMRGSTVGDEEVVTEIRRERRGSRSRRSRRSEMTSRSPGPQRVVRQERIIRETSRPPMAEGPRRQRNSFVVAEERPMRRVDGDDVVEVIEEEGSSVAPRRKSKRGSGYR